MQSGDGPEGEVPVIIMKTGGGSVMRRTDEYGYSACVCLCVLVSLSRLHRKKKASREQPLFSGTINLFRSLSDSPPTLFY